MTEGLRALDRGQARRCAVLTFDDGYLDNLLLAAPILRTFGFTATCYFVSDLLDFGDSPVPARFRLAAPVMNLMQAKDWLAAGMEVGSHTRTHARLDLAGTAAAVEEIANSREQLHKALGVAVAHFCYPYGRFGDATARLVERAGYSSAVTLRRGYANARHDRFLLPRLSIPGTHSLLQFAIRMMTPYDDLRGRLNAHRARQTGVVAVS